MYDGKVIEHYKNPKNVGSLEKENKSVGTGIVGAPECGDVMKLPASRKQYYCGPTRTKTRRCFSFTKISCEFLWQHFPLRQSFFTLSKIS